jgi:hypothetical protein
VALTLTLTPSSGPLAVDPDTPLLQADPAGAVSPNMFFRDWFPLTVAFSLAELEAGSSGNRVFDKDAGAWVCPGALVRASIALGPGTELGVRTPEAALNDQGVFLGP